MKKILLFIIVFSSLISCKKEEAYPENHAELILQNDSINMIIGDEFVLGTNIILHTWGLSDDEREVLMGSITVDYTIEDNNVAEIINSPYIYPSIRKVDIRAKNSGRTRLIAKLSGIKSTSDTCIIEVTPVYSERIIMDNRVEMFVGEKHSLNARIIPSNSTNTNIQYSSSNESIATVDNGVINAISSGDCTITAKSEDGKSQATCYVSVKNILVESVSIPELENNSKFMIGEKMKLTHNCFPDNSFNKNVKITISNESVLSINENLEIEALSKGNAIVTISSEDGNASKSYDVEVGDISIFISLSISGSYMNIFGNVTGSLYCTFINNSYYPVEIKSLIIYDGYGNTLQTIPSNMLGIIEAYHTSSPLGCEFNKAYYPKFVWIYEYDGNSYSIEYSTQNN